MERKKMASSRRIAKIMTRILSNNDSLIGSLRIKINLIFIDKVLSIKHKVFRNQNVSNLALHTMVI